MTMLTLPLTQRSGAAYRRIEEAERLSREIEVNKVRLGAINGSIATAESKLRAAEQRLAEVRAALRALGATDSDEIAGASLEPRLVARIRSVLLDASRLFGETVAAIRGEGRTRELTYARFYCAKRLRDEIGMSYTAIGRTLNRDHTTAQHEYNSWPKARAWLDERGLL